MDITAWAAVIALATLLGCMACLSRLEEQIPPSPITCRWDKRQVDWCNACFNSDLCRMNASTFAQCEVIRREWFRDCEQG